MKKVTTVLSLLLISSTVFADLNPALGSFRGQTALGEKCYVQLTEDSFSLGYKEGNEPWVSLSLPRAAAHIEVNSNTMTASGSSDGTRMKLTAQLNSQGNIVSATFRIGMIFGKKIACLSEQ